MSLFWMMEERKNNSSDKDGEQSSGPGVLDSDNGARVQQLRSLYMEPLKQLIRRTETAVRTDRSNKQIVFFKKILNFLRDPGERIPMTNIFYFEKFLRKLFGSKGNLSADTSFQQASASAAKSSAGNLVKKQRPNEGADASSASQAELMLKIQKATADCKKNLKRMLNEKYTELSNARIPKLNKQPSETRVSTSINAKGPPEPSTHTSPNTDFVERSLFNVKPYKIPKSAVAQSIISEVRSRMINNKVSSRKRVYDLEANNVTKSLDSEGPSLIKQTRTCTPRSCIELDKQSVGEKTTGTYTFVSSQKLHANDVIPPSTKSKKMPLKEQTQTMPANATSQAVPANARAQTASSDAKLTTNYFYGEKNTSPANSSPDFTKLFTDLKKDLQKMRKKKAHENLNASHRTSNVNSLRHQAQFSDKPPARTSAGSGNSFPANTNAEKTGTPTNSRKRPFLYNPLTMQYNSATDSAASATTSPVTSQTRTSSVHNENSASTATVSSASRQATRQAIVSSQVKGQLSAGLSPVQKLLPASMKPVTQLRTGADRPVSTPSSLDRVKHASRSTAATSDIPSRKPINVPTSADRSVPEQRTSPAQRAYAKYAQRAASLNDLHSRVSARSDDKKTTTEADSVTKTFSTKTSSFKSPTIPVDSGARPLSVKSPTTPVCSGARPSSVKSPTTPVCSGARPSSVKSPTIPVDSGARPSSVKSPTIPVDSGARPSSVKSPSIPVDSGARPSSVKSPTIPVDSRARPSSVKSPTIPVDSGARPSSVKSPSIPFISPAQRAYANYAQRAASLNDLHSRVPASSDNKKPSAPISPSNSGKTKASVINPKYVDKPSPQSTPSSGQSQKLRRSSSAPQRTATNLARTKHVPGKQNEMEGATPINKHGSVRCTEASSTTASSSNEVSDFLLLRRNSRFLNFLNQHTAVSETESASQTLCGNNKTSATKEEPSDNKSGNDYTSKFDKYYSNLTEMKDRDMRSSSTLKRSLDSPAKSLNRAGIRKPDSRKPKSSFLKTMASIAKEAQAGKFLFDKNLAAGTSRTSVSSDSGSASASRPPSFANTESSKQRKLSNSKPVSAAYSKESHAGPKFSFDRDSSPSAMPLASSSRSPTIASTVSSAAQSTASSKTSKLAVPLSLTSVSNALTISSVIPSLSVVSGFKPSAPAVSASMSSASAVQESKSSGLAAESASSDITEPEKDSDDSECIVCFENPVNTVIYSCGHMCLCFKCAEMVKEKKKECPVCRETIKDIIKTYKS